MFEHEGSYVMNCIETDELRWNLLHQAVYVGYVQLVHYLLNKNYPVNKLTGHNGKTALMLAVQNNFTSIVKLLLEHKADSTTPDWITGNNCLHFAIYSKEPNILGLLIDSNAELLSKTNNFQLNPVQSACKLGLTNFIEYIVDRKYFNEELKKMKDNQGRNLLMIAASNGHHKITKLLVERVAFDFNEIVLQNNSIWHGSSALEQAIFTKQNLVAEYLNSLCKTWSCNLQ